MRGGWIVSNQRSKRKTGERKPLKTIFALVEGTSEKVYLERIRRLNTNVSVKVKVTNQKKAVDIVKDCIKQSEYEGVMSTDTCAVIFDCDAISKDDMEKAVILAEKNNIFIALSNLCFEYWLLLHFEEPPMRLDSEDLYKEELSNCLKRKYHKSSGIGNMIVSENVKTAITRADKRLPSCDPLNCYRTLNSTCMHKIAEEILRSK